MATISAPTPMEAMSRQTHRPTAEWRPLITSVARAYQSSDQVKIARRP